MASRAALCSIASRGPGGRSRPARPPGRARPAAGPRILTVRHRTRRSARGPGTAGRAHAPAVRGGAAAEPVRPGQLRDQAGHGQRVEPASDSDAGRGLMTAAAARPQESQRHRGGQAEQRRTAARSRAVPPLAPRSSVQPRTRAATAAHSARAAGGSASTAAATPARTAARRAAVHAAVPRAAPVVHSAHAPLSPLVAGLASPRAGNLAVPRVGDARDPPPRAAAAKTALRRDDSGRRPSLAFLAWKRLSRYPACASGSGRPLALDGMSFTVQPGQVTGFVGPNGAGKSTTMRVILGLDAADDGTRWSAASRTRAAAPAEPCRGPAGRGRAAAQPQRPQPSAVAGPFAGPEGAGGSMR